MRTPLPQGCQRPSSRISLGLSRDAPAAGTPSAPTVLTALPPGNRRTLNRLLRLSVRAQAPMKLRVSGSAPLPCAWPPGWVWASAAPAINPSVSPSGAMSTSPAAMGGSSARVCSGRWRMGLTGAKRWRHGWPDPGKPANQCMVHASHVGLSSWLMQRLQIDLSDEEHLASLSQGRCLWSRRDDWPDWPARRQELDRCVALER